MWDRESILRGSAILSCFLRGVGRGVLTQEQAGRALGGGYVWLSLNTEFVQLCHVNFGHSCVFKPHSDHPIPDA